MGISTGNKNSMPAVAEAPTKKKESPAARLERYRRENAAKPRVRREDSPEVVQHKLEVLDEWADLRERVTHIA
jgi:hypothetical protein